MACKCIDRITKGLQEKGYKNASINNRAYMLDDCRTEMHATFDYQETLKNGKTRKKTMNLSYSHCPFCGVEYGKPEPSSCQQVKEGQG